MFIFNLEYFSIYKNLCNDDEKNIFLEIFSFFQNVQLVVNSKKSIYIVQYRIFTEFNF